MQLNGNCSMLAMPARIFDSDSVVPYRRLHDHAAVHEACDLLCFASGGAPVPGRQKFHLVTLTSNRFSVHKTFACVTSSLLSVDLLCTLPVFVRNHKVKALVDTATNHSVITRDFLHQHCISFHGAHVVSGGIAGSTAVCLGHVQLRTHIGHKVHTFCTMLCRHHHLHSAIAPIRPFLALMLSLLATYSLSSQIRPFGFRFHRKIPQYGPAVSNTGVTLCRFLDLVWDSLPQVHACLTSAVDTR